MSIPLNSESGEQTKAERIATSRRREAEVAIAAGAYRLLSHDMAANVATIARRENPDRAYRVNYLTGVCECDDYTCRIAPLNRRLARVGSGERLECKHIEIAWHLAFAAEGETGEGDDLLDPFPLTLSEAESDHRQAAEQVIPAPLMDAMVWQVLWGGVAI